MRDAPDTVMLFAAGRGRRMAPLTDSRPKPLVSVAGRPLIDHALDIVHRAGVSQVVANTHYLSEQLVPYLQAANVTVVQETRLLETGGGLRNALPVMRAGPVITMNSDAVWRGPNPISAAIAAWRPQVMDALLVLIPRANAIGHTGTGDFSMDGLGRLSRAPDLVYTGVQILKTDRLSEISEQVFSLNRLWDMFAQTHRLYGVAYQGNWCDVGQPESIALAEAMLNV